MLAAASCSRSPSAPVASLGELLLKAWAPDECPLCLRGLHLNHALELN